MNETDKRPVYIQLIDEIMIKILSSEFGPGTKLPAVRDLALILQANPNTVQRALAYVEERGLIYTQRTTGKYVTEDPAVIEEARRTLAKGYAAGYLEKMKKIGFNRSEAVSFAEKEEY